MSWKNVAKAVGAAAPLLGTVLAGPAGGAIGAVVASVFGVENEPNAVLNAVNGSPQAAVMLRKIELDHKADLERMAITLAMTQIAEVNATMRAEAMSEDKWTRRWRPFWGIISAVAFLLVVIMVMTLAILGLFHGWPEAFAIIPQLILSMSTLFGVPMVILGVSAHHRGKMQRLQAGEMPEKSLSKISDALKGVFD